MAFFNNLNEFGANTALIQDNGSIMKYCELDRKSDEIAKLLKTRTLAFLFCSNEIGSILGYISCLKKGVVPVLLKKDLENSLKESLIATYSPKYIYGPEGSTKEVLDGREVWSGYGYCLMECRESNETELYPDLGLLLTTSGSTGSPKLVRQSYQNIQVNAESIAQYLELNETEKPITTLPMNYTYGLSIINSHLLVGATICLTDASLMQKEFWNFFKESEATSFGGVPYTYEMLKKLRFLKMNFPSLRYMTQAGGKLSPELHKEFAEYAQKNNKKFIVMYGQTEATARMAYLPAQKSIEKYGSMGIAIPGGRLWLKDVNGKEIQQANVVGELVYEGENVTLGYAECREDLSKGDERHGILETGDMARKDEEGYFYIVGRKKRFLKLYGNRVNLDEVERMVKSTFEEFDCACAGVDDNLYLFITSNHEGDKARVKEFLTNKTGLNPKAFTIKQIDEIPKNEAGKTLYKKLEYLYEEKEG